MDKRQSGEGGEQRRGQVKSSPSSRPLLLSADDSLRVVRCHRCHELRMGITRVWPIRRITLSVLPPSFPTYAPNPSPLPSLTPLHSPGEYPLTSPSSPPFSFSPPLPPPDIAPCQPLSLLSAPFRSLLIVSLPQRPALLFLPSLLPVLKPDMFSF